jgi:hypothetical protein
METLMAKDAKCDFGRLIDLAETGYKAAGEQVNMMRGRNKKSSTGSNARQAATIGYEQQLPTG